MPQKCPENPENPENLENYIFYQIFRFLSDSYSIWFKNNFNIANIHKKYNTEKECYTYFLAVADLSNIKFVKKLYIKSKYPD